MTLSKKERRKRELAEAEAKGNAETRAVGLEPGGRVEKQTLATASKEEEKVEEVEIPRDGVVCG
jgi:tRNA-dihydrouridine synthase 1